MGAYRLADMSDLLVLKRKSKMVDHINTQIIEALRLGTPPQKGVERYSVGKDLDQLIEGIQTYHLSQISDVGKIRFISGSWGSGKTHLFRVIRDRAFKDNCVVSNVELSIQSAPLNKFEQVFYSIVRNMSTPNYLQDVPSGNVAPFGNLVETALYSLSGFKDGDAGTITFEQFTNAVNALMSNKGIDIDFKKMIERYWKTYVPDSGEETSLEQIREETLQWFAGEGTLGSFRKRFGVNKMPNKQNSKLMLQSLSEFVKFAGYKGILILFDEAEQSYSIMRKTALRDALNNLLSLIASIEDLPGLIMIYATTDDFYTDEKHGIRSYGALSQRIGKPRDKAPKALDKVWNLDAMETSLEDYKEAAKKIRLIYCDTHSSAKDKIANESKTAEMVDELYKNHSPMERIQFWRLMVSALIMKFDAELQGDILTPVALRDGVMEHLREQ
jgi:hypothetical protein